MRSKYLMLLGIPTLAIGMHYIWAQSSSLYMPDWRSDFEILTIESRGMTIRRAQGRIEKEERAKVIGDLLSLDFKEMHSDYYEKTVYKYPYIHTHKVSVAEMGNTRDDGGGMDINFVSALEVSIQFW